MRNAVLKKQRHYELLHVCVNCRAVLVMNTQFLLFFQKETAAGGGDSDGKKSTIEKNPHPSRSQCIVCRRGEEFIFCLGEECIATGKICTFKSPLFQLIFTLFMRIN